VVRVNELIWIDVETTGLDPELHEIIEIGWVVTTADGTDRERGGYAVPFSGYVTSGAAAVNGFDPTQERRVTRLDWALNDLGGAMKARRFAGQNPRFDEAFLRRAFRRCEIRWPMMDHHLLDLAALAWPIVLAGKTASVSLDALCDAVGVEREARPHSALAGALKAVEVYRALLLRKVWL
jgi:DNA polymerase III epsilon subunit-like protein